jgi:hypothetical protein
MSECGINVIIPGVFIRYAIGSYKINSRKLDSYVVIFIKGNFSFWSLYI